jgi:hypothetical protein
MCGAIGERSGLIGHPAIVRTANGGTCDDDVGLDNNVNFHAEYWLLPS